MFCNYTSLVSVVYICASCSIQYDENPGAVVKQLIK